MLLANNLWLPIYTCLHKVHVSAYKEAVLHDSDSISIAGNQYLHFRVSSSLHSVIMRRKSNIPSGQNMAKGSSKCKIMFMGKQEKIPQENAEIYITTDLHL